MWFSMSELGIRPHGTLNFSRPASASEAVFCLPVFLMLLPEFVLICLFLKAEASGNCLLVEIREEKGQLQ